ncbi:MAG TPA: hypothetical protein PKG95_09985 [Anaerolineaceae bacterium]|nr:hypothetical protein [Anaerolineaceae bacterium]
MTARMMGSAAFEAAQQFIEKNARPLEVARFRQAFAAGPAGTVFAALKKYQNPDGGFGQALEPDLRARESSALGTSVAFQVIRATPAPPEPDLVARAVRFLLETLDRVEGHWRIIPIAAEQSPHAPWWHQTGREAAWNGFSLNPSAELLGYLCDYAELVPADVLALLAGRVLGHLGGLQEIGMHDLLCCIRLFQTRSLPGEVRTPLTRELNRLIPGNVACLPAQWSEYSLRPLQVVTSPESPFLPELKDAVEANLNYEISTQNPDGSWTPNWTWGGAYPEDWLMARREWSGIITLEKLLLLKTFGRIAEIS